MAENLWDKFDQAIDTKGLADDVTEAAEKLSKPYLVVDYKDVYNNNEKNINMRYTYRNPSASYSGEDVNLFVYFYPSLTKHNSSKW